MAQKRKLQVFVSSTYTDLVGERQTAVEAILTAGHIPAGMELFAGQNEEQMNIIKEWIDESDIYLLLLGGRYGSVDENTKKSYTHLEYEYAKQSGKVIFVVVAHDDYINNKVFKNNGNPDGIIELVYRNQYTEFKSSITGKYVKYWTNDDSLKLAIINTLHVLERDEKLIGWVPGSEATNSGFIAEELAKLVKENAELRSQLEQGVGDSISFNGLELREVNNMLAKNYFSLNIVNKEYKDDFVKCYNFLPTMGSGFNLLYFITIWGITNSQKHIVVKPETIPNKLMSVMEEIGLVENISIERIDNLVVSKSYKLMKLGRRFVLKTKARIDPSSLNHIEMLMKQTIVEDDPSEFKFFNE